MTDLVDLLTLEDLEPLHFVARQGQINRSGTVYGGQLLGQLVRAAELTISDKRRRLHGLQACFERPATADQPIDYFVECGLDGGSESVRRVRGMQNGRVLITASAGFGPKFSGIAHSASWQSPPPAPESLPRLSESVALLTDSLSVHGKSRMKTYPQVEIRPVEPRRHLLIDAGPAESRFWIRAVSSLALEQIPDAPVIAYLSDYLAVNAALAGHVEELPDRSLFVATLNHSLWIHAQVDPREWLYFEMHSPWAEGGRALCTGKVFNSRGELIAHVAQATMLRPRRED